MRDEKKRNNAARSNIWNLSLFLAVSERLSKKGTPGIHRVPLRNTATAEQCMRAEASGKTSMKNKRKGRKKKKKNLVFFKGLYRCSDNLMSPSAFFAFMQIDSLLLGKWLWASYCLLEVTSWLNKLRKAALWKSEKVFDNVRNSVLLVAHALRTKAHRQIHSIKQNFSGTNVMPVPNTQKVTKFCLTGSWEYYNTAWLFQATMCCFDLLSGFLTAVGYVLTVCPSTTGILFVFFRWKLFLQLLQEENWECGL